MKSLSFLSLMRLLSILASGFSGLLIANTILSRGGTVSYANYAILIALPSLLPFLDLGLGLKLNSLILDDLSNPKKTTLADLNRITTFLFFFNSFLMLVVLILINSQVYELAVNFGFVEADRIVVGIILILTLFNVVLSLGSRVLFAIGNTFRPLMTNLIGTILILVSLPLIRFIPTHSFRWLSLLPMIVMVLVNVSLFSYSQKESGYRLSINPKLLDKKLLGFFKFGFLATLVATVIPISLQIPKYLFGIMGSTREIANYTLFLLFLQPLVSISVYGALGVVPKIRALSEVKRQSVLIRDTYIFSSIVGALLSIGLCLIIYSVQSLPMQLPPKDLLLFLVVLVPILSLRQNLLSTFTKVENLQLFLFSSTLSIVSSSILFTQVGAFTAYKAIGIFLLFDNTFAVILSFIFYKKHLNILRLSS